MVVRPLLLHGDTDRIIIPFFPKKHKAGLLLFAAFPPGPRRARLSAPPWKNAGPLAVFRGYLREMGYGFTQDEEQAQIIVLNT